MFYSKYVFGVNKSLTGILIFVQGGDAPHPRIFATQHLFAAHTRKA